jgi:hypothetical protein
MQAQAQKNIETPLEYSAQDRNITYKRSRKEKEIEYRNELLKEVPDFLQESDLEDYIQEMEKVLYEHSGTREEVLEKISELPEAMYKSIMYTCCGNFGDARRVMSKYVRDVSYELTRLVNDPEDAITAYETMETALTYLELMDSRVRTVSKFFLRPQIKKLIIKEKGRLKKKRLGEKILAEKKKQLEEKLME